MIWSRDRWNLLSRGAARWMLCAGTGALALAVALPLAMAQQAPPAGQLQPKSTQAPKAPAAGAAGAPAAAAPAGATEDAWVKLCMKSEQTQNKEICLINHEGLEPNTGMVLIAAAVRKGKIGHRHALDAAHGRNRCGIARRRPNVPALLGKSGG